MSSTHSQDALFLQHDQRWAKKRIWDRKQVAKAVGRERALAGGARKLLPA